MTVPCLPRYSEALSLSPEQCVLLPMNTNPIKISEGMGRVDCMSQSPYPNFCSCLWWSPEYRLLILCHHKASDLSSHLCRWGGWGVFTYWANQPLSSSSGLFLWMRTLGSHVSIRYESATFVVLASHRSHIFISYLCMVENVIQTRVVCHSQWRLFTVLHLLIWSVAFWKDEMCSNEHVINITKLRCRWWQCST